MLSPAKCSSSSKMVLMQCSNNLMIRSVFFSFSSLLSTSSAMAPTPRRSKVWVALRCVPLLSLQHLQCLHLLLLSVHLLPTRFLLLFDLHVALRFGQVDHFFFLDQRFGRLSKLSTKTIHDDDNSRVNNNTI